MPQAAWNDKRERQYDHIKEGMIERGQPEDLAEEIAARTVNKERARTGEAKTASRTSTDDISSARRGGLRSHRARAAGPRPSSTTRPSTRASVGGQRCPRQNSNEHSGGSPRSPDEPESEKGGAAPGRRGSPEARGRCFGAGDRNGALTVVVPTGKPRHTHSGSTAIRGRQLR